MLIEKSLDDACPECGERMEVAADYGEKGASLFCPLCSHAEEVIDLAAPSI